MEFGNGHPPFKIKACFGYRHFWGLLSPQLPTKYALHDSILINNSIGLNYIRYVNVSCKSAWLSHHSPGLQLRAHPLSPSAHRGSGPLGTRQ